MTSQILALSFLFAENKAVHLNKLANVTKQLPSAATFEEDQEQSYA